MVMKHNSSTAIRDTESLKDIYSELGNAESILQRLQNLNETDTGKYSVFILPILYILNMHILNSNNNLAWEVNGFGV